MLALVASAGVALGTTAPGKVRVTLEPALGTFEAGDVPWLYLRFENVSPDVFTMRYPTAEDLDGLPSDFFRVHKDGEQLPYRRGPESHSRSASVTALLPEDAVTLAVSIDEVCLLPPDPVGRYRVEVVPSFYPETFAGRPVEFEVRSSVAAATTEGALGAARWSERFRAPLDPEQARELVRVARRAGAAPGLRVRAVRAVARGADAETRTRLQADLVTDPSPAVAMAAVESIGHAPPAPLDVAVVRALAHRDLGVRRAAARQLIGATLPVEARERVRRLAASSPDELLRRLLSESWDAGP
jgi:hypothetical protein